MRDTLERLDKTLRRIAPAYMRDWERGSSFKDANRVESGIQCNLPEDFRTYLIRHDGDRRHERQKGGFWLGLELLSTDEILSAWEGWRTTAEQTGSLLDDAQRSVPADAIREVYANPSWIPFARDGHGNYLAIDLDPGPAGKPGQVITVGREEPVKYVVAGDVRAFWERMLRWIESGRLKVGTERDSYPDDDGPVDEETPYLWWPKREAWSLSSILPEFSGAFETVVDAVCARGDEWYEELTPAWQALLSTTVGHERTPSALDVAEILALEVTGHAVDDLGPVRTLPNLREVTIHDTAASDLGPLRDVPHLTAVSLATTPTRDLSPLSGLSKLRQVALRAMPIDDVSALGSCRGLTHLDVAGTPLSDSRQLSRFADLRVLDLSATRIADVRPLMDCGRLEWLSIGFTAISDLRALAGHTSLRHIDLQQTPVFDIDPLLDIPALRSVAVSGGPIADLSMLDWIPGLMEVSCDFAAFDQLRTVMQGSYRISLRGELSKKQELVWDEWCRRSRQA